jgi:endoglucanase
MTESVSRREFVKTAGLRTAALASIGTGALASKSPSAAPKNQIPRWRGFMMAVNRRPRQAAAGAPQMPPRNLEDDFRMIRDLGFDFVRLSVGYWDWVDYTDKNPKGGPLAKDLLKIVVYHGGGRSLAGRG